jgi:phage baseplate assembly protein W
MIGEEYPQVGDGWVFPPRWRWDAAAATAIVAVSAPDPVERVEHVRQALVILLRTQLGSRVMRPAFGAGVDRHVFEPRTAELCHRLAEDVRRAIVLGEPRVIVDSVDAVPAGDADERVDVTIAFRIDRHRRPDSLVLPFFVAGGS